MDYLQQYKDKKNSVGKLGKTGILKINASSARLPHSKAKNEGGKPHSSSENTSPKLCASSTVIGQVPIKTLVSRKK